MNKKTKKSEKKTWNWARAVRCARAFAQLEQRELAEKIGVTPSFVSLIENGDRGLSIETLQAIANACGTSIGRLNDLAGEGAVL